jgi:hypothetical protein
MTGTLRWKQDLGLMDVGLVDDLLFVRTRSALYAIGESTGGALL